MKLIIQSSRIAATATDDYTGPDEYIAAPDGFDVNRMSEYVYAEGAVTAPPLPTPKEAAWERIKAERDRRKSLGVKVGEHWYHSDADSRIQQISLFVIGAAVPPVQWKTLTLSPPPVFVTMTQAIAAGIFQATAASDAAVFGAAETHRVAMEASATPETYDFSGGWPVSIED